MPLLTTQMTHVSHLA